VHPREIAAAFADVSPLWLAAAAAAYALGQLASGLCWHRCLCEAGLRLPAGQTMIAYWAGRGLGELLPGQLGEAVKLAALRRHPEAARAGWMRTAGSLAAFKVVEAGATFLVVSLVVASAAPGPLGGLRWVAVGALVLTVLAVPALRMESVRRRLPRLPGAIRRRTAGLAEGGRLLKRPGAAVGAGALAMVSVASRLVFLLALLAAFGITVDAAPMVFCLVMIASMLPVMPGGFGVREAAMVPALVGAYGLAFENGLAFSLGVQATVLGVCLLGGLAALAGMLILRPGAVACALEGDEEDPAI
jgi:uncharacterized membrane protein YbhN (UPF0104 family)